MEYYVIKDDFNHKEFKKYNIFNHYWVDKDTKEFKKLYLKGKLTRDELIEKLDSLFHYCFWSKAEYEVILTAWASNTPEEKIDIYYQLKDNIPLIADLLINEWNKIGIS